MARYKPGLNRAGTGVVIHGIEHLETTLAGISEGLRERALARAAEDAANVIMRKAKELCPVRTGALRASIHVKRNHVSSALQKATKADRQSTAKLKDIQRYSYAVICGEGFFRGPTYYGGMIEFGTKFMAAQPFMRPAAAASRDMIRNIFRNIVRTHLKNQARRRGNAAVTELSTGID